MHLHEIGLFFFPLFLLKSPGLPEASLILFLSLNPWTGPQFSVYYLIEISSSKVQIKNHKISADTCPSSWLSCSPPVRSCGTSTGIRAVGVMSQTSPSVTSRVAHTHHIVCLHGQTWRTRRTMNFILAFLTYSKIKTVSAYIVSRI